MIKAAHPKSRCAFCLCLVGISISLAAFASDAPDAKMLEGSWVPVLAQLSGKPMPDVVLKKTTLKMDNGKYEVTVTGEQPDRGTCTLDVASKPHGMTITSTNGANRGKTFPAIYELKADTLRICYDLSGAKRPTAFKSVEGTKLYLVTYRRKKE